MDKKIDHLDNILKTFEKERENNKEDFLKILKENMFFIWFGSQIPDGYYILLADENVDPANCPKNIFIIQRKKEENDVYHYTCNYWKTFNGPHEIQFSFHSQNLDDFLNANKSELLYLNYLFEEYIQEANQVKSFRLSLPLTPHKHLKLGNENLPIQSKELFEKIGKHIDRDGYEQRLLQLNYLNNLIETRKILHEECTLNLVISSSLMTKEYVKNLKEFCKFYRIHLIDFDTQCQSYINYHVIKDYLELGSPFFIAAADVMRFSLMYEFGGIYLDFDISLKKEILIDADLYNNTFKDCLDNTQSFYQCFGSRGFPELHIQASGFKHHIFYLCVAALHQYIYSEVKNKLKNFESYAASKGITHKGLSVRNRFILYLTGEVTYFLIQQTSIGKSFKRHDPSAFNVIFYCLFQVEHHNTWLNGLEKKEQSIQEMIVFFENLYEKINDDFLIERIKQYFPSEALEFFPNQNEASPLLLEEKKSSPTLVQEEVIISTDIKVAAKLVPNIEVNKEPESLSFKQNFINWVHEYPVLSFFILLILFILPVIAWGIAYFRYEKSTPIKELVLNKQTDINISEIPEEEKPTALNMFVCKSKNNNEKIKPPSAQKMENK